MSTLSALLERPTRVLFFTGKGGMGKTTLACATAVALVAPRRRVLIVSTDPASNLDEVLGTALAEQPRPVAGIAGLDAANIDPEAAAREYRERDGRPVPRAASGHGARQHGGKPVGRVHGRDRRVRRVRRAARKP